MSGRLVIFRFGCGLVLRRQKAPWGQKTGPNIVTDEFHVYVFI